MIADLRRTIPVPRGFAFGSVGLIAFSLMLSIYCLGDVDDNNFLQVLRRFGIELAQAMVIGTTVGYFVNRWLNQLTEPGLDASLRAQGIKSIYPSRVAAMEDFLQAVRDPHVKSILIAGLSLRDFLTPRGSLQRVWETIRERLEEEQQKNFNSDKRLRVRLLLLDPLSGEGKFRSDLERESVGEGGLDSTVGIGLDQVHRLQSRIYGETESEYLQARLYEHCPYAFHFVTDQAAYVEQYCYRDHSKSSFLPLLRFRKQSAAYAQLVYSCEAIWKEARHYPQNSTRVGSASAIREANIVNIFRHDIRDQLGRRQIECLRKVPAGGSVSIQAITGRYFIQRGALAMLSDISLATRGKDAVKVRFLIINPVSQQAILRAVAESAPHPEIGRLLAEWTWEKHKSCHLYNDAWQVIETLKKRRRLHEIELHLTPAPLTSFLLLTPDNTFIETYVYGRSTKLEKDRVLGAEYPALEFERASGKLDNVELEVLQSAFNVMWEHFSIPVDKYERDNEETNFERNLEIVRAYSTTAASGAPGPNGMGVAPGRSRAGRTRRSAPPEPAIPTTLL